MRRFSKIIILILCVCLLTGTVLAESSATSVSVRAVVSANGQATVTMTVNLHLDAPASALSFPLPVNAKNVTMNGQSIRTYASPYDANAVIADLSSYDGAMGEYQLMFSYTLSDVLSSVEDEQAKRYYLQMEVPLLSGFEYKVEKMDFSITMPGDVTGQKPTFTSGVMQTGIDSIVSYTVVDQMIAGTITRALQDRETVSLVMEVSEEMFPGKLIIPREGNPEIIPMSICAALALIYWIIFMRTMPVIRHRRTTLIEGVTAGELGSRLTAAGADLTMMVFSWAQLGYVKVHVDRYGRVILEKRMEMGNERTDFELRCFHALFAKEDVIDATGIRYAKLCRRASENIPGVKEMYSRRAGNVKIFRILACGVSIFCGICFAMNITAAGWVQTLLKVLFVIVGAITAWAIQDGMYKLHVRGKIPVYVGMVCGILWMVIGVVSGQWIMGIVVVAVQNLAGLAAAYGGRRSELGRFNASEILGVRHYLKHVNQEDLDRMVQQNPDYFFDMLPYAIALGVDTPFAKAFGNRRIPECTYLTVRKNEKRSAAEWAYLVRKIADRMDEKQRKMELEKWLPLSIGSGYDAPPPPRRPSAAQPRKPSAGQPRRPSAGQPRRSAPQKRRK